MENHIITVMRSGQNYLQQLLAENTNIKVSHSHHYTGQQGRIITIARDPFDSIVSRLVMHKMLSKNMTEEDYRDMIEDNLNTYTLLAEHSDIVIDYNDLVSNPLGVVDYLVKATDNSYNDRLLKMKLKDKPSLGYLVSSKVSNDYDECLDIVKEWDLSSLYKAYKPLYEQTVIIGT